MSRRSNRSLWTAKLTGESVARGSTSEKALATALEGGARRPFRGLVLGIDPSLRTTGLALLEVESGGMRLLFSKTLRLEPELSFAGCLGEIFREVTEVFGRAKIRHVAIEQIIHVQNRRIGLIMGSTRGAAMAASALKGAEVFEYPPKRVKQAVVGFGAAGKKQVALTMAQHLRLPETLPADEADAAAVALCHAFTWRGS